MDDIRQAQFDRQSRRFNQLKGETFENALSRCRELFDLSALLQALTSEINSLSDETKPDSLSCQFLNWVAANLNDPHVVFSKEDVGQVAVSESLVLACLEYMFLGKVSAPADEQYCGRSVAELFAPRTQVLVPKPKQTRFTEAIFIAVGLGSFFLFFTLWTRLLPLSSCFDTNLRL